MSRKKKDGQFCSFFLDKKTADNLTGISKITNQSKTLIVEQCLRKEAAKFANEHGEIASIPAVFRPSEESENAVPCQIIRRTTVNGAPCYKIFLSGREKTVPESAVSIAAEC